MLDTIYLLLFRIFGFLIKVLPNFVLSSFAKLLSKAAYGLDKKHVKIANANLDFAFDNTLDRQRKKEIILLAYENLVKNLVGIVKNLEIQKAALLAKTEYEGLEIIQKLQSANKNIIFVTAHYGNWEAMGKCVAAKTGLKLVAVGRELDVKSLNDALKRSRERFDSELISKHGAMRKLVKALKEQKAVGILVDQNTADDEGLIVSFFGKEARQTPVASVLARRFEAAIIPVFCEYTGFDSYKITFHEPIYSPKTDDIEGDILSCTQAQSDAIEKQIRKNPDVWFWFHKRWKNRYEGIYR